MSVRCAFVAERMGLYIKPKRTTNGNLGLTVSADAAQTVSVSLCSVFGTVVKNLGGVSLADGDNNLEFKASLLRGVYVFKVSGNGWVRSKTVTSK